MQKEQKLPELSFRALLLGSVLTIIFTASNVYLGLKVGLTFSSSIPAVIISMAVLSMFKNSNILENNIVQTEVSAAGTLSAVIFVIPGLFMCGYWSEFPMWQSFMICLCGGTLGVLFTIPLRRVMVNKSKLSYPEGRAAAEILKLSNDLNAGEKSKEGLKELSLAALFSALMSIFSSAFKIVASQSNVAFMLNKMSFAISIGYSFALVGAGYIVGLAGCLALLVGMILAWGIFTPYLSSFADIKDYSDAYSLATNIWALKVRLIGTGAIAIAALWTLIKLLKPVFIGMQEVFKNAKISSNEKNHLDTDMSLKSIMILFVLICIGLFITFFSFVSDAKLSLYLELILSLTGTLLAIFIGFFVAAACGYMAGLVGSSSSPISGIGLIAIIASSLTILFIGSNHNIFASEELSKFAIALSIFITSVVLGVAAISNDNLQDLKTGQLVGASPKKQQIALLIGCFFGSLVITPVLNLLYKAYGFVGAMPKEGMDLNQALAAPQANLMSTIAQGIFHNNIDYKYILFGVFIGVIVIIIDIILKNKFKLSLAPLAVGIGIYLPPSVNVALVIGGFVQYFVFRYLKNKHDDTSLKQKEQKGILFASGLIVGESIIGVIIAAITVFSVSNGGSDSPLKINFTLINNELLALILFVLLLVVFVKRLIKN